MFVDKVRLTLTAGSGGSGVIAWRREKFVPKGGPCGGDGGSGGSISLQRDDQVVSLDHFRNRRMIKAENGEPGGHNHRHGKKGDDLVLTVPTGTVAKDVETGEVICDFVEKKRLQTLCKGGKGGKGNDHFKSSTHQAPYVCTPGEAGESREVELELKLIADIGLIGMPNAGKSSLMSRLTHLDVRIGAYPFTTLFPNLSYIQYPDQSRILVADIPGIIEGAHMNRGLGFAFLRHIERSAAVIYVIDASGIEERDPLADFDVLQSELGAYRAELLEKPRLVVFNKIDLPGASDHASRFRSRYPSIPLFEISALTNVGIDTLLQPIFSLVAGSLCSSS